MKKLEIMNKVWIALDGKKWEKVLYICGWLYLVLNSFTLILDGITFEYVLHIIIALLVILYAKPGEKKEKGRYVLCRCKLTFDDDKLIWEYPEIDLQDGKGILSIRYIVEKAKIQEIVFSEQLQSICFRCKPIVEHIHRNGKVKRVDYRNKVKSHSLILYNNDLEDIISLCEDELGIKVQIIG